MNVIEIIVVTAMKVYVFENVCMVKMYKIENVCAMSVNVNEINVFLCKQ